MIERVRLDPDYENYFRQNGIRDFAEIALNDILIVQESYRRHQMPKAEARERIIDRILQIHDLLTVEPAMTYAEEEIATKFNARILPRNSSSRHYADHRLLGITKRVATAIPGSNIIFAVFHPDVGLSIADYDTFNKGNLLPTVNYALEHQDFHIPNRLFGYDAYPMSDWIPQKKLDATIAKAINLALFNYMSMSDEGFLPGSAFYITGLNTWSEFGFKKEFIPFVSRKIQEIADFKLPHETTIHFPPKSEGESALIYGGLLDPDYGKPEFLNVYRP